MSPSNWSPFFPYGIDGVIHGIVIKRWRECVASDTSKILGTGKVFFSYVGFDAVTTLAGEVKRPKVCQERCYFTF